MLELIVLGEVPGTHIVITLSWAIALMTVFFGSAALRAAHRKQLNKDTVRIEDIVL